MKSVSTSFISKLNNASVASPIVRVKAYAKYPGPIRSVATSSYSLAGVSALTISVYGNAARFFHKGDSVIVKSTPLTNIADIITTPTFNGTNTLFSISDIGLSSSNVGGHVLRDLDYKFTVGST